MPARRAWQRASATLGVALVVVAGCSVPPTVSPPPIGSPAPSASAPTAATPAAGGLAWEPCAYTECSTLAVPLDHARPAGPAVTLAVARVAATRTPRLGTIFVNPGGPGVSGRAFVGTFDRTGLEAWDIVGWDPRGVGASTPVVCPDGPEADAYLSLDGSPDDPGEVAALVAGNRAFAEACRVASGDLLDHLAATDTARDLDLLRQAVGDERLTFYGASYGTAIGAAYAALFPDRVGRLVLDAGVAPRRPAPVPQAVGFERGLGAFAAWCAEASCPLAARGGPVARLTGLLETLDDRPLPVAGGRLLTQTLATAGLTTLLAGGEAARPALADAVGAAEAGDGSRLLAAADLQTGRRPDGSYGGLLGAFTATYCADDDVRTPEVAAGRWAREREAAPVFGTAMGSPWLCVGWTADPAAPAEAAGVPDPSGSLDGRVLVLGGPGDPVTPYAWSEALADHLGGAVLVATPGEGHVAYGRGVPCVDAAVRGVLGGGVVPTPGTSCA